MYIVQILSLPNSKVVAAARSPAKAVHLQDLQKQHEGRLTLVALDLSETSTAQVSRSVDRDAKLDVAAFLGYCMSQHSAVESTRDSQLLAVRVSRGCAVPTHRVGQCLHHTICALNRSN